MFSLHSGMGRRMLEHIEAECKGVGKEGTNNK